MDALSCINHCLKVIVYGELSDNGCCFDSLDVSKYVRHCLLSRIHVGHFHCSINFVYVPSKLPHAYNLLVLSEARIVTILVVPQSISP